MAEPDAPKDKPVDAAAEVVGGGGAASKLTDEPGLLEEAAVVAG